MNLLSEAELLLQHAVGNAPADVGDPAILSGGGEIVSHAHLGDVLRRLRGQLRGAQVPERTAVVLFLPEGPSCLISLLAVSGVWSCAPMNPALAWEEIEALLRHIRPAAVIVSSEFPFLLDSVLRLGLTVLSADGADEVTWTLVAKGNRTSPNQTHAAIMLHTSGTTGRSKLVGLTLANLDASMQSTCSMLQLTRVDRVLLLSPLFHLQGILSAMSQLRAGGSVIATRGFERGDFPRWLQELKPTWYTCGPTLHRTICSRLRTRNSHGSSFITGSLRFVRSIGAPLSMPLAHDIHETLGVPVLNGYGLTETGVLTSVPFEFARTHAASVGRTVGAELRVVDVKDRELPSGCEGEIVVRGANVTTGYVDDPAANEVAFRSGWFHTGDLGTIGSDGFLYVTGRLKEQINRAGEKIHPGEIDEVMLGHPEVLEAAAFGAPHSSLGENIFCAVVLTPNANATSAELRRFIACKLAGFKVPRRIFIVDRIPRSASGKPRRHVLAAEAGIALGPHDETKV